MKLRNVLDFGIFEYERSNSFRQQRYLPGKLIDGYFVQIHPEGHKQRNWYESDRRRWLQDFGTSLAGRKKGIIQLNFKIMSELEQILEDTDLRAAAIARLLVLIERDSAIIDRHREVGSSGSYVQQYVELREANLAALAHFLEAKGTIRADLHFS